MTNVGYFQRGRQIRVFRVLYPEAGLLQQLGNGAVEVTTSDQFFPGGIAAILPLVDVPVRQCNHYSVYELLLFFR